MAAATLPEAAFALSPPQRDFFWDDRRFLVFIAGRGSGKSTAAVIKLIGMIERGEIKDGARILIFGPTYPQLKKGTIPTFDKWFDAAGLTLSKVDGNEPERRLIRGITAYFRNASNPEQTRSHEVQVVWLDEAAQMDESVVTLTNAALRQFGNDADYTTLITSTPRGRNWIWRWFVNRPTWRFNEEQFGFYTTTTEEAYRQGVVRDGYLEELGYLPGSDMYNQEVLAQFNTWSGLVFDQYDETKHSPVPFTHPEFSVVYGGIDPGYSAFTSMHLSGATKQGAVYTFEEYYVKRASPHEWMEAAAEMTHTHKVKRWYVDPAAKEELRAMRSAGLPAYPAMKANDAANVAVGYINGMFKQNQLFIDREKCPFIKSEIESYQFKEQQTGDEVTFLEKVKPNQLDHAIDDWRYHVLPLSSWQQVKANASPWSEIRFAR